MKIVNGWLDAAVEIDYLNKSMDRQGHAPTHVVLHGTAGGTSAQAIGAYFRDSSAEASAHFIIGQDGTIVQGVPCSLAAWGNGIINQPRIPWPAAINPNYYTISIEHCKPSTDNNDNLTSAQQRSSFQLITAICDAYGIAKKAGDIHSGIVSHADFDSVNRARCPGAYPWNELFAYLKGGNTMGIPQGWQDNGTTLTASNNVPIQGDYRTYVLGHNWDANNTPEQAAQSLSSLELSNPTLGPGTWQPFKQFALEQPQGKSVIQMFTGRELLTTRKVLSAAQNKLSQINALSK